MAEGPCPRLAVCVLGLSREKGEHFIQRSGIGKSCFCYRFMHPGYDEYIADHPSLLALHEFESQQINNVHFLYWGSTTKSFPLHGGPKQQRIEFHVVEHTVFYQDVTSQPFTIITKPDSLDHYIRRATGQIESPGKVSYKSRDTMSFQEHACQMYPSGISGWPRGFIVVVDVSQTGPGFNSQIARAEKIMEYLMKHKRKFVIAVAKRDIMDATSLDRVHNLKKKYKTQVFETSANGNLNISETFRYIASKVLQKKVQGISDQIPTYEQAAHNLLTLKGRTRRSFMTFLKKRVVSSDERLNALERMEEYKDCTCVVGKFETDRVFAEHLLEVHNKKVELYAGVKENPELRLEFLEDFLDQRTDLAIYSESLKRWIKTYVETHPVVSSDEESSPEPEKKKMPGASPSSKEMTDQAGYQIFEKPGSPSAQSHHTLDSGVQQDSPTHEGGSGDSYYSDSFDSSPEYEDIVEYINFPLPPSERLSNVVATDGEEGATVPMDREEGTTVPTDPGGPLGSESQETDSELLPPLENDPPQVGPESTVPSVSELQATSTGEEEEEEVKHTSDHDYLHILATDVPKEETVKEEEKEKESGNVRELTAKVAEQSNGPSPAKPKVNEPPPPSKKPNHTLSKSTSEGSVRSPPGSGNIKRRATQLERLLTGKGEEDEEKDEELMPTSSETLKQPNSPHQETIPRVVSPPDSYKPAKRAPKPPVSPKSRKKKSVGERTGNQISRSSLQDEQLQSQPSPNPPSPTPPSYPPPTSQVPQAVTETVKDNASKRRDYEARLPFIKKKIAERRQQEQQQKESTLAGPLGKPEVPGISHTGLSPSVSPDSSSPPPPPPPRQRAPSSPLHPQSQVVSPSSPPPPPPPRQRAPSSPLHPQSQVVSPSFPSPCTPRQSSPTPPPSPLHHRKQMPLPPSPPHQERNPPPNYIPPPPPPSQTDQGAPISQLSFDSEENFQPPLPQRTEEMFLVRPQGDDGAKQESPQHTEKKTTVREVEEKGEGRGKKRQRRFYQDVVLPKLKKVLGREEREEREEREKEKENEKEKKDRGNEKKEKKERESEKEKKVKGPSFMNMSQRPLPAEPFNATDETDHEAWEYEPIDTAEMLNQRPVAYATHHSPSHPSLSPGSHLSFPYSHRSPSPSHQGARSNSPNSVRRVQSFQPFDTRQTGPQRDIRAYKYPSPPSIAKTQTVQQKVFFQPESCAVGTDGYVDTESSTPGESLPEYDYPDTRAFRTLPHRNLQNKMGRPPVEPPPRSGGRSMTRTLSASSDYIPMASAVDDSYINWETIGSIRSQLLFPEPHNPPTVPTKNGKPSPRFALDDLATVYMNLPIPEKPLVLPPRKQEREQQPTLETIPASSARPIPSPRLPRPPARESPSTSKKPKPRPRVKANATTLESTSVATVTQVTPETSLPPFTSSISEKVDLLRPNYSPNPRHPQLNHPEEIMMSSSLPPSFGDSFGEQFGGFSPQVLPEVPRRKLSDRSASEPQAVSQTTSLIPPRNILRQKKISD